MYGVKFAGLPYGISLQCGAWHKSATVTVVTLKEAPPINYQTEIEKEFQSLRMPSAREEGRPRQLTLPTTPFFLAPQFFPHSMLLRKVIQPNSQFFPASLFPGFAFFSPKIFFFPPNSTVMIQYREQFTIHWSLSAKRGAVE